MKPTAAHGATLRSFLRPSLLLPLLLSFVFISAPLLFWQRFHLLTRLSCAPPALTFTTLTFGPSEQHDARFIEHNCALLSRHPRHRFVIYATNLSVPACRVCECRQFLPVGCPCARPEEPTCNHCEKIHFFAERMRHWDHMVFLDADLVVLKDAFVERLSVRAMATDALAAVGHAMADVKRFYGDLNSGLVYMKRLEGLDYGDMVQMMRDGERNEDQGYVSEFIWRHYENWDTLSLRWHCRLLTASGYDIPHDECYTLHDRREVGPILEGLNFTLSTVKT